MDYNKNYTVPDIFGTVVQIIGSGRFDSDF